MSLLLNTHIFKLLSLDQICDSSQVSSSSGLQSVSYWKYNWTRETEKPTLDAKLVTD